MATHSQGQHQRYRAVKACLRCQSRKIKCDGKTPSCNACMNRGDECVYASIRRTRGPGKSKQKIQSLEGRLEKMESLLHSMGGDGSTGGSSGEAGTSTSHLRQPSPTATPSPLIGETRTGADLSTPSRDDGNDNGGQQRAANERLLPLNHSGFSIFQQVRDRFEEFQSMKTVSFSSMLPNPAPLRPTDAHLLRNSADDLFDELPLFSPKTLLQRLDQPFALEKDPDPLWWSTINGLIAYAAQLKTDDSSFRETLKVQWSFFKNAYAVYVEFMVHGRDLAALQAMLAMVMYSRTSADMRLSLAILSTAIRTAQSIGLHRKNTEVGDLPNSVDDDAKCQAFWMAFILDSDMSLNCGVPPLQPIDEIERDLPSCSKSTDGFGTSDSWAIFVARAELATIQSRVRAGLHTPKALRQPESQLLKTVTELDLALEDWKSRVPIDLAPADRTASVSRPLSALSLHLAYLNCVSMVHWPLLRHTSFMRSTEHDSEKFDAESSQLQVKMSIAKVRAVSTATLELLSQCSNLPFGDTWRLLTYLLSSAITLFTGIISQVSEPDIQADTVILGDFARSVKVIANQGYHELEPLGRMIKSMVNITPTEKTETNPMPHVKTQTLSSLLTAATHPMYLAQAFMSNLPNRDEKIAHDFAAILGIPWDSGSLYGPLTPRCLMPDQHGFKFDS